MKCGKKGHFAKCCQTEGANNFAKSRKVMRPPQQQFQRIDDCDESSNDSTIEEGKLVLTIEGDKNGQFTRSGKNKRKSIQNNGRLGVNLHNVWNRRD